MTARPPEAVSDVAPDDTPAVPKARLYAAISAIVFLANALLLSGLLFRGWLAGTTLGLYALILSSIALCLTGAHLFFATLIFLVLRGGTLGRFAGGALLLAALGVYWAFK